MSGEVKPSSVQSGADGTIDVEFVDSIAILRMNRGENRINDDFIQKMESALDQVENNPTTKALITTGSGRFYCNGLDLAWLKYKGQRGEDLMRQRLHALLIRLVTFPMPTLAAIDGHAFAGGGILSLVHDYRLMRTKKGFWCMNEVHLGMFLREGMLVIVRNKLSPMAMREVIIFGKRLGAEAAQQLDIVHKACDADQLIDEAIALAKQVTENANYNRENLRNMKADIWHEIVSGDPLATPKL